MRNKTSAVFFDQTLSCITCNGCKQQTPVSTSTQRNPERFMEAMEMAEELHRDCEGKNPHQARLARIWRQAQLSGKFNTPDSDKLVWSAA